MTAARGVLVRFVVPLLVVSFVLSAALTATSTSNGGSTVAIWMTTPDRSNLLSPQAPIMFGPDSGSNPLTIDLDESTHLQQMDGFGASFTDSSAWLVANTLSVAARTQLLTRLFDRTNGIGLSYLRQPMGASDFALSNYTYDDVPAGQTDFSLVNFSIAHDTAYIIPVITQALAINPSVRVMATPWSPPAWMKSNQSLYGGSLNADASTMSAYANYFVKFIQQYTAAGVPIHRITPQNEPLNTSTTYPTMSMSATQQATFIASHLAPALAGAGLRTEIVAYDHNWDNTSYAASVLGSSAGSVVTGTAWHCYAGAPSAMSVVHNLYPTKGIHFTECTAGEWNTAFASNMKWDMENLIIGAPLNWARTITKQNIALDRQDGPHNGGCSNCRGLVMIDDTVSPAAVTFNFDYYTLGHISKFVQPGAFRIGATTFGSGSIEDVAFINPDGSRAVVVFNGDAASHSVKVRRGTSSFTYSLAAGAAATFTWSVSAPRAPTNVRFGR
jgi:glucosylceramidase